MTAMPDSPNPLSIEVAEGPAGSARVRAVGELDLSTTPGLRSLLDRLAAARRTAILDLTEVTFMDSTGLALLIDAARESQRDGWSFALTGELSTPVARLFEMTDVRSHLPFADRME